LAALPFAGNRAVFVTRVFQDGHGVDPNGLVNEFRNKQNN
jgi:hypothetical protein